MKKGCKKLAQKLSCVDTTLEAPYNPTWSRSQTTSMSTAATSASDTRAASSSVRTPQNRGKGPADEDDVDEGFQYDTTSGNGDDDDDVHHWDERKDIEKESHRTLSLVSSCAMPTAAGISARTAFEPQPPGCSKHARSAGR
jgi:hypothetical protein